MAIASHLTEVAFASHRQSDWDALDVVIRKANGQGLRGLSPREVAGLSPLYRDVCADLSYAQAARYSAPLIDYLTSLTASAHTVVYSRLSPSRAAGARRSRWLVAFPRAVRAHWKTMLLATLLFFVPLVFGFLASVDDPHFAFRVVPESQLRPLTEAYARGFAAGRQGGEAPLMAGFYVNNNVGIALRCFATGIFLGLGSAFFLVQNGLSIGATLGYVTSQGAGGNILVFIVGHSAFELGAIVLAGGAGMSLGWSVVSPGDQTRLASLQAVAKDLVVIVCGAAVMLLIAASLEAFWSGSSAPNEVKLVVGGAMLILVLSYLLLAGRERRRAT